MRPLDTDSLRGYVPFHLFNDLRLQVLANQCERIFLRKDQVLLEPGSIQNYVYFLLSGRVVFAGTGEVVGAEFGYPLNYKYRNQDTVTAVTDCSLFRIDKILLDKFVCWAQAIRYLEDDIACQHQLDDEADWMRLILQSNLFYKVPPLNIHRVFSQLIPMPVKKGAVILTQGEVGDGCYFIKEGSAVVTRTTDADPQPVILAEIGVGRCFGEDALVHETVRNATITMLSHGLLMKMEKRDFVQLLKEPAVETISSVDLEMAIETGAKLLDVRSVREFEYSHLKGSMNLPLDNLRLTSKLLDTYSSYIICCDTDRRSRAAAYLLERLGFRARALAGGLNAMPSRQKMQLLGD